MSANFVALIAALAVFWLGLRVRDVVRGRPLSKIGNGFPGGLTILWLRVKALVSRGTVPGTGTDGTDSDTTDEAFEWGAISREEASDHVVIDARGRTPAPTIIPPVQKLQRRPEALQTWVDESVAAGARTVDIVREGVRRFGVSDRTVKRRVASARKKLATQR